MTGNFMNREVPLIDAYGQDWFIRVWRLGEPFPILFDFTAAVFFSTDNRDWNYFV